MNGGCHMRGSHYNIFRSWESEASSQRFLIVNGVSALFFSQSSLGSYL